MEQACFHAATHDLLASLKQNEGQWHLQLGQLFFSCHHWQLSYGVTNVVSGTCKSKVGVLLSLLKCMDAANIHIIIPPSISDLPSLISEIELDALGILCFLFHISEFYMLQYMSSCCGFLLLPHKKYLFYIRDVLVWNDQPRQRKIRAMLIYSYPTVVSRIYAVFV